MNGLWQQVFGLSGLLNPFALILGAGLGWYSLERRKLIIAGLAGALLSFVLGFMLQGRGSDGESFPLIPSLIEFPFRLVGATAAAFVFLGVRRWRDRWWSRFEK